MMLHDVFVFCYTSVVLVLTPRVTAPAALYEEVKHLYSLVSPFSAFAFFFAFLLSRRGFARSSLSSVSSSDFSDLTSSGLNHTGGC